MGWPQWIVLVSLVFESLSCVALIGKKRTPLTTAGAICTQVVWAGLALLLWWGGFWNGGSQ